ncbi:syntaxin-binding protein 5-like isoform X5 [Pseudochaenichthys georgianus]|uniref:syntaxin-binding protein 5-like isoform X5 n=1 Tax=Pseudochaenichthys georgianus TaxID=52239 RepID=UPI00146F5F55|nr:syntaxin-binding protein 5-like isoform X6 [Pseudochaenichthys georgianus]
MKKFRKVLDGLTTSSPGGTMGSPSSGSAAGTPTAAPTPKEIDIQETLVSENFQMCKTVRHGFPYQPTALAFDPVQKILAIGSRTGGVRILGRPGVDCYCQHESGSAVLQLQFLINEGALVTACADDTLHLWNLRQRRPAVLHSLKFNRERITFCHLPFQSKWLYVGTERGNTHIVNIESFILSGYVIMWNKAIELSTKTHPGPVVHLSDCPKDEGKLLIGFESGMIVQWDLRGKKADFRICYDEAIHSAGWHHEGKQFMCSHSDGSLSMWNLRNTLKPFQVTFPHGKIQKDGRKESCKPILKVEYKTSRSSEPFVIFSGGLSYDKAGRRPTLTIMHGKAITVLEMDYPIVEFMALCETPYNNEVQEPYAVVVLLEKDLIVVDLTQSNYPVCENPYPMDIHESPVTCTAYFADCPPNLIPILYSIGAKHKKTGYSQKEWPIAGGLWTLGCNTYPEIILTGHADGSIKFWDASAITLQMLYKLKTSKAFEKPKPVEGRAADLMEEDPFAVQMVSWCPQSRILCVVGISAHIILYRFSKYDANTQITSLEVRLQCESEDVISPSDNENNPCFSESGSHSPQTHHPASPGSKTPEGNKDTIPCLKVKERMVRVPPGYQAELVIQLLWVDGEPPQQITSLDINSAYGLLAFGNCNGLAVVDYLQKTILLCMSTLDLYGGADPYQRLTRSPRRNRQSTSGLTELSDNQQSIDMERSKSPTSDHVNGHCTSPTSQPSAGKPRVPMVPEGPRLTRRGPGRPPFRKAQSAACMEISLPVSHTEVGYASRRAMLQQFHGVTMYSHDEHHSTPPYSWTDKESRENSFSRSRSSSVSSIDRDTKEAITTLQFGESYGRKNDALPNPCLWVGTSLGVALVIPMSIPTDHEERMEVPVTMGPSGTVLMLKGSVLRFGFLDCMGSLIQSPYEVWRDLNGPEDPDRVRKRKLVHFSPSSSQDSCGEGHLAVVCSERQAKVILMPSQSVLFVHNITESSFVLRADVVSVSNSVCLACFCANGHIMTLSLPSLRPLMDVNYLPLTDMRIARTFCFTNGGQALYLSSPTEIQRITYSQEMCDNLQEMLGELFTPIETPEAQNRGFLKGFFGGNSHNFDREELFGEASAGKASRSLAQHIPGQAGMEGMKVAASGVVGDLARARIALDERGQRLGELEDRTALMMTSADVFSKHAHELMLKCKDKKWYQF